MSIGSDPAVLAGAFSAASTAILSAVGGQASLVSVTCDVLAAERHNVGVGASDAMQAIATITRQTRTLAFVDATVQLGAQPVLFVAGVVRLAPGI